MRLAESWACVAETAINSMVSWIVTAKGQGDHNAAVPQGKCIKSTSSATSRYGREICSLKGTPTKGTTVLTTLEDISGLAGNRPLASGLSR